jgi:hypothetical protein
MGNCFTIFLVFVRHMLMVLAQNRQYYIPMKLSMNDLNPGHLIANKMAGIA